MLRVIIECIVVLNVVMMSVIVMSVMGPIKSLMMQVLALG